MYLRFRRPHGMSVKLRQELEERIVMQVVDDLLAAGYPVDVFDGEEVTLKDSTDRAAIRAALFTTDEDYLYAKKNGKVFGWVYAVYGNDGYDVISDYTVNLEPILASANKIADRYA
jgi:hypothetical protein